MKRLRDLANATGVGLRMARVGVAALSHLRLSLVGLEWRDARDVVFAFVLLAWVDSVLHGHPSGLRIAVEMCRRHQGGRRACSERSAIVLDNVVWAVTYAGRCFPAIACLERSLASFLWLRRLGVDLPLELVVGVNDDPHEGFVAHAWMEMENEPVFEMATLSRVYRPIFRVALRSPRQ